VICVVGSWKQSRRGQSCIAAERRNRDVAVGLGEGKAKRASCETVDRSRCHQGILPYNAAFVFVLLATFILRE